MELIEDRYKLKKITYILFIISIMLIPFDNLPYFGVLLGELGSKGAIYPMLILVVITFITIIVNKKVYCDHTLEKSIVLIFLGWTFVGLIGNAFNISGSVFKNRTGIEKSFLQVATLIFLVLAFNSMQIIIKNSEIKLSALRKYILYSFYIVSVYGIIEALHVYTNLDFMWIISKVSHMVHSFTRGGIRIRGIRSVTGEASYLAMYLAFSLPWILSYVYTEKKIKNKIYYGILTLLGLVLFILTQSRTAYGILAVQIIIFFIMIFILSKSKSAKKATLMALICILVASISIGIIMPSNKSVNSITNKFTIKYLINSLKDNSNLSNVARFGMQRAAFNIGKDNPVLGVGLGQFGFYVSDYIDDNALRSEEVQNWTSDNELSTWPMVHSLYFRIIAEQGLVGILVWILLIIVTAFKTIKRITKDRDNIFGIFLFVSFTGVCMSFLNVDTYALMQFWFMLAVLDMYNNRLIENK